MNKLFLVLRMELNFTNVINNVLAYHFVPDEAEHLEKGGSFLCWVNQSELHS